MTQSLVNVREILYNGLEGVVNTGDFERVTSKLEESIFNHIIAESLAGKINWKRDLKKPGKEKYTARVKIKNASGSDLEIDAIFFTSWSEYEPFVKEAYLCLGNNTGPTRNSIDERVMNLARKYFGLSI